MRSIVAFPLLAVCVAPMGAQQAPAAEPKPHLYAPGEVTFGSGPASLPRGVQLAVLEGNPAEAGPFTMRLKLPDGYRVAPHWHPALEHVTVIQGTFIVGAGDKADRSTMRELPAGSFMMVPPRQTHYVRTRGETIIQVHGVGPWGVTYVNPADDPRNQAAP